MEEIPDFRTDDRGRASRKASTLALLRAANPGATDRLVSGTLSEPDPNRINLGLLRQFFERRAAARAARKLERVEAVFRIYFRLPMHLRSKAAEVLLRGGQRPVRRPSVGRQFRPSA